LNFHFFASLTQFERELIRERTVAGLAVARARGRLGGRKRKLDDKQIEAIRTL
jgi:DNA invertase Pin-like site-specific DNA recombinase